MSKRINTAVWYEEYKRWQIKVQKNGIRKPFYSSTPGRKGQIECNQKADKWLESGVSGTDKVEKVYKKWLQEINDTTGKGNHTNDESIGRVWILPEIGNKKMEAVTEQDCQNILNKAYKDGRTKKTIANIRGAINGFLKYARKSGVTTLHPEELKIPKKAPTKGKKVLSQADIDKLFGEHEKFYFYLNAFRFCVATGLRRGELVALQKPRDLRDGILTVRKSINKFGEETDCKTDDSRRQIRLNDIEMKILADQEQMLKAMGIKSKYIFPNTLGLRTNPETFYKRWTYYRDKEGYESKISIHEMRHTFISMCKDVPLELLKQFVGHSVSMDTFAQYGHEMDGEKEKASALVNNSLSEYIKM